MGSRTHGGAEAPESGSEWGLATLGKVTESVVHDFNNILASISGFAELIIASGGQPPEAAAPRNRENVYDFARFILQAALSGQSTIRTLRHLTHPEGDDQERLDIREVLDQSQTMVRAALGGKIALTCEYEPGPAWVTGSRSALHNVFINLILNARDAMPAGGRISLKTYSLVPIGEGTGNDRTLVVSVKDTGTGMTQEVRNRIFDRFFTTKGPKGNGLGLVNVLGTVKAHGGRITVDSAPGCGTEFWIHLPLAVP